MGDLQRSPSPSERTMSRSPSPKPHVYIPSELTIRPATTDEVQQVRKATYSAWGRGKMTLEQYMTREQALDQLWYAPNRLVMTWVLVPRSNPYRHPFLSSCEVHRREGFLGRAGNPDIDDNITAFGIASVFTPQRNRRNGYARHMLRLIHRVLAAPNTLPPFPHNWGQPPSVPKGYGYGNALFSILYSDVGNSFYSLCGPAAGSPGWEVRDPWSSIWTVADVGPVQFQASGTFKWIPHEELEGYLRADRWRVLSEDLPAAVVAPTAPNNAVYITTPPDHRLLSALIARYKLGFPPRRQPPDIHFGACAGDQEDSYCVWVPEPHENSTLLIVRLRCNNTPAFETLLKSALFTAEALGLRHVELWNSLDWDEGLRENLPFGGKFVQRSQHLPSLAWYGSEPKESVVWHANERFAWC